MWNKKRQIITLFLFILKYNNCYHFLFRHFHWHEHSNSDKHDSQPIKFDTAMKYLNIVYAVHILYGT